jgi:hypothetical protein
MFFFVTAIGGILLVSSLFASWRPLTKALGLLKDRPVRIALWGAPPPELPSSGFILSSVNVIGVGTHVFFVAPDGRRHHLKVAQPGESLYAPGRVTIRSARYVQWNSTKLRSKADVPAVEISLLENVR